MGLILNSSRCETTQSQPKFFRRGSILADDALRNHRAPKPGSPARFSQRRQLRGVWNFIHARATNNFKVIFEDARLGNGWCRVSIFHICTLGRQVTFWYIG